MGNLHLPMNELRISIISSCNMKCEYCHNEGNTIIKKISIADLEPLINAAMKIGLESVRLTGGEPLLHDEIVDICKMIKSKNKNLKIGINTNGILINKLLNLIDNNLIDRVIVGVDYFDKKISKASTIGNSSKTILENVLKVKNAGCDVTISNVYDGDYQNLKKLVNWTIQNDIRIKILEKVDHIVSDTSTNEYLEMREKIIKDFNLEIKLNELFNEKDGYINGKRLVSFFQSHCRLRECNYCKNIHLRVTSDNKFKPCLLNSDTEFSYNESNVEKQLQKSLKYLGVPPKNKL